MMKTIKLLTSKLKIPFILIVIFKLGLLYLFSSEQDSILFQPFVNSFIENDFINPWQFYFENNLNLDSFPYHNLMLLILTPFSYLSNFFNLTFLFKTPLLFADLIIFFILVKSYPNNEKKVYMYYFLNPIIIYATYMHSQLDIIPTALLFYSIYLLTLNKYSKSAIIFGLALVTKFHVIAALPLIFFYLFKMKNIQHGLKFFLISFLVFFLIDLPVIFSSGFSKMVLLNSKQSLLFDSFFNIGPVSILLPIAVIAFVYLHFFNQKKVNFDLLYFYFGILFISIIFFIYSGPAWYIWIVPFMSLYFINNDSTKSRLLYFALSFLYLVFFIFFYKSDYTDLIFLGENINFKIDNHNLSNIVFTLLEVILFSIMYVFYKYGIRSNSVYKKQVNLVIGIGGDSGVGKTTLLNLFKQLLGDNLLEIEGDGEHKWERGNVNWNKLTHLDPKANHIHRQSEVVYRLKNNEYVFRSEYNHSDGSFSKPRKIIPKEFIVIAGLHPFYLPKLRKIIDFKVYLDTDETLRRHWKIIRDTKKRGYSHEKIIQQIQSRIGDAKKYIYPQKNYSDLCIKYYPINTINLGNSEEIIDLGLKLSFDANIQVDDILSNFISSFKWDYNDDLKTQYIQMLSEPSENFEEIAKNSIVNINEIISSDNKWETGYAGLIQLILLLSISEKLKNN